MRNCPSERVIDRYILGRLPEEDTREFELHYFNCLDCYERLRDREDFVGDVIRKRAELLAPPAAEAGKAPSGGAAIVAPPAHAAPPRAGRGWLGLPAWAAWAAVAATVLVLVVAGGVIWHPWGGSGAAAEDSVVRGQALAAVAPAGDVRTAPAELSWQPGAAGLEFRVELSGPGVRWTGSAGDGARVALPEDIRAKFERGAVYTWQVKGYAPEGTLLERSKKTTFRIR